jgi:hypothetical protein
MITVAGSVLASTYLPLRAKPASSGKRITSPIATPLAASAQSLSRTCRVGAFLQLNGLQG